ncbi:MAG: efflux RND transporter periplasmic adaptor subunit [Halieaceae bacterium]
MALKKSQFLISLALLAAASLATWALYLNRPSTAIEEPEVQLITVDVAVVSKKTIRIPVHAQGTVTPLQSTVIQSEVKGRVTEVSEAFNVGGFVNVGDVLLRIDPRDYQTNLLRAQAAVESAESNLAQERGRAEVALREWKKLPAGSQRSDEARDLYLRKPQLEQAEAQLLAARADLDTARDNLERTIIRSPYPALIRHKHIDLGQFVAMGSQLAEVVSVDFAEVRLPLPQSRLEYLDLPGLSGYSEPVAIDLYTEVAGQIRHWPANLHRTEGVFDERSRVLFAVARVEDPYGLSDKGKNASQPLRIGTFVNARIEGKSLADLVTLPRHVLRAGNNLWVIDSDDRLRNREVAVLRVGGEVVYVEAGLEDGDRVSLTNVDVSLNGADVSVLSSVPTSSFEPVSPADIK